jgi:HSP20 family protein
MSVRDVTATAKNVPVQKKADPFRSLQQEVNHLFDSFFGETAPRWLHGVEAAFATMPAIDVAENSKGYTVMAEIPGMDAKDVQVTACDGYLTIKGEKKEESHEEKQGYFRQERSYGSFQRMVQLPAAADMDKVDAHVSRGVLTVTIARKADAHGKERKIDIKQAA